MSHFESSNFNTAISPINLVNINQVLEPSSIEGVMKPKFTKIYVQKSEWLDCLYEIEQACGVRWIVFKSNKLTRQLRIEILRDIDRYHRLSERKVNYFDIYNIMKQINKVLYLLNSDDLQSVNIWINEKLPSKGYLIFRGNLQSYSSNDRDDDLGRGFPCGYTITNDHSVQWLQFLKESNLIVNPLQFTIDCSDAETNAINNVFPEATSEKLGVLKRSIMFRVEGIIL
ncbi:MAG: hypothetical protein EXX96DRAFT_615602 [Benjaminiella poitrasii]|nr:MAG: hypothetical protein EXX96DRAFT_615602 [Benjaminiella poitrasii]